MIAVINMELQVNNWITVHNPHPNPDTLPWHIYLQDNHKNAVDGIKEGDRIFFYETKGSKLKDQSGHTEGAMGIVCITQVIGEMHHRDHSEANADYIDGETKSWTWCVPTANYDFGGFVARRDVVEILGYKDNYYFRGFNAGRGVKKIRADHGQRLNELFSTGHR